VDDYCSLICARRSGGREIYKRVHLARALARIIYKCEGAAAAGEKTLGVCR